MKSIVESYILDKKHDPRPLWIIAIIPIIFCFIILLNNVLEVVNPRTISDIKTLEEIKDFVNGDNNDTHKIYYKSAIELLEYFEIEKTSSSNYVIMTPYGGGYIGNPSETTYTEYYKVYILENDDYNVICLSESTDDYILFLGEDYIEGRQKYEDLNDEILEYYKELTDNGKETFVIYKNKNLKPVNKTKENVISIIIIVCSFVLMKFFTKIWIKKSRLKSDLGKAVLSFENDFDKTYAKVLEEEKVAKIKNSRIIIGNELLIKILGGAKIIKLSDIKDVYYEPDSKYPEDIFKVYVYFYDEKSESKENGFAIDTYSRDEAEEVIKYIKGEENEIK